MDLAYNNGIEVQLWAESQRSAYRCPAGGDEALLRTRAVDGRTSRVSLVTQTE
jgi:hypothetical protein